MLTTVNFILKFTQSIKFVIKIKMFKNAAIILRHRKAKCGAT